MTQLEIRHEIRQIIMGQVNTRHIGLIRQQQQTLAQIVTIRLESQLIVTGVQHFQIGHLINRFKALGPTQLVSTQVQTLQLGEKHLLHSLARACAKAIVRRTQRLQPLQFVLTKECLIQIVVVRVVRNVKRTHV
jgi:hypothetical protein